MRLILEDNNIVTLTKNHDELLFLDNFTDLDDPVILNTNSNNYNYKIIQNYTFLKNKLYLFPSYISHNNQIGSSIKYYCDFPVTMLSHINLLEKYDLTIEDIAIYSVKRITGNYNNKIVNFFIDSFNMTIDEKYHHNNCFSQEIKKHLKKNFDNLNTFSLFLNKLKMFFYFNTLINYYQSTGRDVFLVDFFPTLETINSYNSYHKVNKEYSELYKEMSHEYHSLTYTSNDYSNELLRFIFSPQTNTKNIKRSSQYTKKAFFHNTINYSYYSHSKLNLIYIGVKNIISILSSCKINNRFYQYSIDPALSHSLKKILSISSNSNDNYVINMQEFHDTVFMYYIGWKKPYRDCFIRVSNVLFPLFSKFYSDNPKENDYYLKISVIIAHIIKNTSPISNNDIKELCKEILLEGIFTNEYDDTIFNDFNSIKSIIDYYVSHNHAVPLKIIKNVFYS